MSSLLHLQAYLTSFPRLVCINEKIAGRQVPQKVIASGNCHDHPLLCFRYSGLSGSVIPAWRNLDKARRQVWRINGWKQTKSALSVGWAIYGRKIFLEILTVWSANVRLTLCRSRLPLSQLKSADHLPKNHTLYWIQIRCATTEKLSAGIRRVER